MPEPTLCPVCNQPLRRSPELIADAVTLQCRHCRRMAVYIEGMATEWIPAGADVIQRLREIAEKSLVTKEILTSSEDDPRWEPL